MARAAPPPQFDGRGAQQVLDAAADCAASLRAHRAVSSRLAAVAVCLSHAVCGPHRAAPQGSASLALVLD